MPLDRDPQINVAYAIQMLNRKDWISDALRSAIRAMSQKFGIPLFEKNFEPHVQNPLTILTPSRKLSVFMYSLEGNESVVCLLNDLEVSTRPPFIWGQRNSQTEVASTNTVGVAFQRQQEMHLPVTLVSNAGDVLSHIEGINLYDHNKDVFQYIIGGTIVNTIQHGEIS